MTALLGTLLGMLALPAAAACAYLLALTLLSAPPPPSPRSARRVRFNVVVPAHNEAAMIGRCLDSLAMLDWPADRLRRIVVADNCTDATAVLARSRGVFVIERRSASRLGKGYALALAFRHSEAEGWADAVVVVDADAEVSPNLLEAFAVRIERGEDALQAHYGVLNPDASWRTRLLAIAHGAFHTVRSRARERLGLSCGVRGNGWCVTHRALARVPYQAFSMTEDLEYGIALGLAGQRVAYVGDARADADMAPGAGIARHQRQRWESGRFELLRSQAAPLLRAAVRQRSALCLDLALDLLVLPLSYLALQLAAVLVLAFAASWWLPALRPWLWVGAASAAALAVHVLRGWQLSGRGAAGLLDLLAAPAFIAWKLLKVLRRPGHAPHREWGATRAPPP